MHVIYLLIIMDLISKLPESLVHRILYFLPTKDVVRTSCLSKTWRCIQTSYPTVNFIQRYYDPPNVFQEFMKHSLQRFIAQKSGVQRFKLCMASSDDDPELNDLINQWINYVATLYYTHLYSSSPLIPVMLS